MWVRHQVRVVAYLLSILNILNIFKIFIIIWFSISQHLLEFNSALCHNRTALQKWQNWPNAVKNHLKCQKKCRKSLKNTLINFEWNCYAFEFFKIPFFKMFTIEIIPPAVVIKPLKSSVQRLNQIRHIIFANPFLKSPISNRQFNRLFLE